MDCAILNEMFIDDDSKHTDKRSKQLLRESERDMKRASVALVGPMAGLVEATNPKLHLEERAESMPVTMRTNGLQSGPLLVSFFFLSLFFIIIPQSSRSVRNFCYKKQYLYLNSNKNIGIVESTPEQFPCMHFFGGLAPLG